MLTEDNFTDLCRMAMLNCHVHNNRHDFNWVKLLESTASCVMDRVEYLHSKILSKQDTYRLLDLALLDNGDDYKRYTMAVIKVNHNDFLKMYGLGNRMPLPPLLE